MEYIKCPNCGGETPAILTRCRHCGERMTKPQPYQLPKDLKDRNGFVTFWLWLGIIVNSLLTIFWFSHIFSSVGLWDATPEPLSSRIITFICSLLLTIGYIMLLCWLRPGFYLLVGVGVVESICFALFGMTMKVVLAVLAPLLILYLVLQCTKNGKTYWELLSNHIPKSDEIAHSNRNGFVSFWLYAGAVGSVISLFMCTLLLFDRFDMGIEMPIRIFLITFSMGCLGGYYLLIKGIRVGFYLITALFLINGINTAFQANANQWIPIVTSVAAILILFVVLQIKKDGKSCWELLS